MTLPAPMQLLRISRSARLIQPGKGRPAAPNTLPRADLPPVPPRGRVQKPGVTPAPGWGGGAGVIALLIALTGRAHRRRTAAGQPAPPGGGPPRPRPVSHRRRPRPCGTDPQRTGPAAHHDGPRTRPRRSQPPRQADQSCPRQGCGAQQPRLPLVRLRHLAGAAPHPSLAM